MVHAFTHPIQIEFAHTDMAGIVHFAQFFEFMEATEHAFFRSFGQDVHVHEGACVSGWVRAHAECDYMVPVRYPDRLDVHLKVVRKGTKSITYGFTFERVDPDPVEIVARGRLVVVHLTGVVGVVGAEAPHSAPIPPTIAELIEEAPEK